MDGYDNIDEVLSSWSSRIITPVKINQVKAKVITSTPNLTNAEFSTK